MAKASKKKPGSTATAGTSTRPRKAAAARNEPDPEQRYLMIQEAAYYRAEKAGFSGDCMDHWLEAERQIDQLLRQG